MFARILVPLDGSRFAEAALPLAAAIARGADATLELVSAYDPLPPPMGSHAAADMAVPVHADVLGAVPATAGELRETLREERTTYLMDAAQRVRAGTEVDAQVGLLDGPADRAITERVESSGADLVVMATHGRGPMERAWLGSVADRLVRSLHVPVLLVRPRDAEHPDMTASVPSGRVVVSLDGSPLAEGALEPAGHLATALAVPLVLLRAVGGHVDVGSPYIPHAAKEEHDRREGERKEAGDYLREVADGLAGRGVEVGGVEVVEGGAARAILEAVDPAGGDVVAMATHGRGGVRRLVLGSVTDKVVRASTGPVLVVRPDEDEGR